MLQHHEASCNKVYIPPMPERSGLLLFVPVNPFAEVMPYYARRNRHQKRQYKIIVHKRHLLSVAGLEIATYLLYIQPLYSVKPTTR